MIVSLTCWRAKISASLQVLIDFVFQSESNIVPLEVKGAENLQAKSLKYYCQKYKPGCAVRTSMSDYREEEWLTNVPLYAINLLPEMVATLLP